MAMYPCLSLPSLSFPSVSGAVCSFDSQYAGLPLKAHTVDIDSVSGVSAIHIQTCGVNQWDEQWELGDYNATTGAPIPSNNTIRTKNPIRCMPNTNYYKYIGDDKANCIYYYDANGDFISRDVNGNSGSRTITTPANCHYMKFATYNTYGTTYNNNISINYPSTNTSYNAFVGQSITVVQIGSTINKGVYDARTGILEVTQPSVQTLQLPPCPIDTLQGVNNIWADTGDTEISYIKLG